VTIPRLLREDGRAVQGGITRRVVCAGCERPARLEENMDPTHNSPGQEALWQRYAAGYEHPLYAVSLSEFGTPVPLPQSGGWILQRQVAGTGEHDAMACYPLLCCRHWSCLPADLEGLEDRLVSFTAVVDPFGDHHPELLQRCFPDRLIPFKQHFIADLRKPVRNRLKSFHRRNSESSLKKVRIEMCENPADHVDDWTSLYRVLVERHQIKGLRLFSRQCFEQQLRIPGMIAFRALHRRTDATVGMLLWYVQGEVGYYHLGAFSQEGYQAMASFALFSAAIQYFESQPLRWLSFGGGAGLRDDANDGLAAFKRGWASDTRMSYFCGRILNKPAYERLAQARGVPDTDYFPVYRAGEFA
jgi:hypothetical protein